MFGVLNIPFCVKASEIDMYFTLTAFLNSDQPRGEGSVSTCGWWLPVWTNQPLMLLAMGNKVVLDDSEPGALNLSFPMDPQNSLITPFLPISYSRPKYQSLVIQSLNFTEQIFGSFPKSQTD